MKLVSEQECSNFSLGRVFFNCSVCGVMLEPNWMFFVEQYCNNVIQCCNIDVQVDQKNLQLFCKLPIELHPSSQCLLQNKR